MLKILIATFMLIPTIWLSPLSQAWSTTMAYSLLLATMSLAWLSRPSETAWTHMNSYMAIDHISAPLLVLTCWLLPLMVLASWGHMTLEPAQRQRTFLSLLTLLQTVLILAFSATELMLFYLMFESTLIPTLIMITRWGNQAERLNAGTYFLFYTLAGSLPLLISLMVLQNLTGTLSLLVLSFSHPDLDSTCGGKALWVGCLVALLVKMPLYGVHLWLPKAHVEAPVAGSMILAAVLLKLGGYGMMRITMLLTPLTKNLSHPFIALALWGLIMSASICLRQTDLKSLIAYSSVAHMGLVIAGVLTQTIWGYLGALVLMVAHGLTSSTLFCLANTNYERTHSRTAVLVRGTQLTLPLMGAWWLATSLANLALPPLPNLVGELLLIVALFNWSTWSVLLTGAGTLITAAYSLYMFLLTQRGRMPPHILALEPTHTREHLLLTLHLLPLLLLMLKPELIWS
uniref:NADH-ubiquinone oxidoreductase chain 4 n=1 Tax=Antennariidae sp. TaxID=3075082 RepID=A0AA51X1G0_9TELE|nr:NADH dehydrogenase subunit 4 [Antennariidae sp.]